MRLLYPVFDAVASSGAPGVACPLQGWFAVFAKS